MSADAADICVVYLLRKGNSLESLEQFLNSYRSHSSGVAHDLVIIFKGYSKGEDGEVVRKLAEVDYQRVDHADEGFDLQPYLQVASEVPHRYVCFLNSFSYIVADDWLRHFYNALARNPRSGLVGATASWESCPGTRTFPNYHIRTNGFMIERRLFLDLEVWPMTDKHACYRFESGQNGITSQLLARGHTPLLVDSAGKTWEKEVWNLSETFRLGQQTSLLIADRRTDDYAQADEATRKMLHHNAWIGDPLEQPAERRSRWKRLRTNLRRYLGIRRP